MSDNLNKVVEEILDDYLEYDENGNSFMNSEEFEKLTDGKYERYDPRDRLAQALTTLINNEKIAELEKILTIHIDNSQDDYWFENYLKDRIATVKELGDE